MRFSVRHGLTRLVLCCLLVLLPGVVAATPAPQARAGQLDLSSWDFEQDGIASLDGEWRFHPQQLLDPGRIDAAGPGLLQPVPEPWNTVIGSGLGHGTYHLRIDCGSVEGLALAVPFQHSAVALYVNGRLLGQQGQAAAEREAHRPALAHQVVKLRAMSCPLDVVAQVSNHELFRGGLVRSIELGTEQQLMQRREHALARSLLALGAVLVVGLFALIFYFGRRHDRVPLYFGLYCLSFALALGLAGERPLQPYVSALGFESQFRLLFTSWWVGLAAFPLFVRSLYRREMQRWAIRAIVGLVGGGIAVTLVTPVSFFGRSAPLLQMAAVMIATYLVWVLIVAWHRRRSGAGILLAGLGVLVAAVTHDVVFFQHVLSTSLLPYGVMGFVLAPAILLARRFSRALAAEELRAIEQSERADLLVRSTQAGLLDWNAVSGHIAYSDRYREMLGYPAGPNAPEPPPIRELIHPGERDKVHAIFVRQLRDRSASGVRTNEAMDYRMRRADGEYIWVHAEAISLCGADGRTLRYICSFIDITEAKHQAAELAGRVKFINDLFDSVPLGLALRDPEGRYLIVNRTWETYIGIGRESVVGTSLRDLRDPAAQSALALDRQALALGPGTQLPSHEYDYNGRRHMQTRTVISDAQGELIGVLAASLDITAKYQTEQALSTERERLRLLVRSTRAGFGDWDAVRDVVTYSDRFKEMLGWPADADTSAWPSIFEMMHPDDQEEARERFRAMIRRKQGPGEQEPGAPMSYRLRRHDGSYVWIHAESISQVDQNGRTRRVITSYLDVTAFREQEVALRAQVELTRYEQRRLDLMVRAAKAGIVDFDAIARTGYYSARLREILGYAPDADTSGWPDYFDMIHPEDRKRVAAEFRKHIVVKRAPGELAYHDRIDYRLLRADGSWVWVQGMGVSTTNDEGMTAQFIASITDISERRAQEETLRAQAAQLEQQNEALKENVRLREEVERIGRHDIKTPLNSIVAVPRLLREERRLGPEADELLGIIERAGYRILSMVNLSLDLYKMEQGSYVFRPDAVDLADLVNKVIVDIRLHAASKQVRLQLDVQGAPYAWAEELLCYSLLANLLKNAVEASPEGGLVTIAAEAMPSGGVVLRMHNLGVVPEPVRATFFQKYATMGKASGTGLGTYSARLMARVQDGDIAMETSEAAGTTLTVSLRAAPAGKVPATVRHAAERRGLEPGRVSDLPALRVLLVDDDEYNLLIVRRFLPTPPLTVATAINGKVALAAAGRQWPDVVFMDLDMPVMGGLEAVQALRAMEREAGRQRCIMVALSSHEDEEMRQRSLAAGFDRYLTKPVTRETIHQTLLDLGPQLMPRRTEPVQELQAEPGMDDPVFADPDIEPVLDSFMASRRQLINDMARAVDAGDRGEVRRIAHQLSGSFGLYGFLWASEHSRWVEVHSNELPAQELRRLAAQLTMHLDTVRIHYSHADA